MMNQKYKQHKMMFLRLVAVLCVVMGGYNAAYAQSLDAVTNEVERLQRDMKDLQKHIYRDGDSAAVDVGSKPSRASAIAEVEAFEERLRDINGKIEELEFLVNQSNSKIDRAIADFDERINNLSHSVSAQPKPVDTVEKPNTNESATLAPDKMYEQAFGYLREKSYSKAAAAFETFIEKNPESELASNARYWLGETFYVRENYGQAAVHFLKTYQTYPKSQKAVDALIKLAASMKQLDKKSEACAALKKAQMEYPKSAKNTLERITKEIKALSCL
jgi:tol-pal system protein YbgF